jgi:hypothetical protein
MKVWGSDKDGRVRIANPNELILPPHIYCTVICDGEVVGLVQEADDVEGYYKRIDYKPPPATYDLEPKTYYGKIEFLWREVDSRDIRDDRIHVDI